ncbi:hypothetical protein PHMEG_00031039, partial [Phytophthora megakarya]
MVRSLVAEGQLARVTTRIWPTLTAKNKLDRVQHVLSYIDESTHTFEDMDNVMHVDEKWYYEDKDKRSYMLFPGEELPYRSRKIKHFIPKLCSWQLSQDHVVNRAVYKSFLLKFVIPAIKEQWPVGSRGRPILIQQDNAKPH